MGPRSEFLEMAPKYARLVLVVGMFRAVTTLGAQPAPAANGSSTPIVLQGVVPTLRLRGPVEELPEGFESVMSIRELRNGRVLVTTGRDGTPMLVSFRDRSVTAVSRTGDGPGEFRTPTQLIGIGGDSTLVVDRNKWILIVDDRAVRTLMVWTALHSGATFRGGDNRGRVLEMRPSKFGQDARTVVYQVPVNAESTVVLVHERGIVGASPGIVATDTVARLRGPFRGVRNHSRPMEGLQKPVTFQLRQPLATGDQALLFADGWIALVHASPYRVEWRRPDGTSQLGEPIPRQLAPVDDLQKRAAIAKEWAPNAPAFGPSDYPPWPSVLPPFLDDPVLALPDGGIAIRQAADARRPGNFYDLIDRRGALTGELVLPIQERVVGFGGMSVYVVRRDSDDVEWLQRRPWPPQLR